MGRYAREQAGGGKSERESQCEGMYAPQWASGLTFEKECPVPQARCALSSIRRDALDIPGSARRNICCSSKPHQPGLAAHLKTYGAPYVLYIYVWSSIRLTWSSIRLTYRYIHTCIYTYTNVYVYVCVCTKELFARRPLRCKMDTGKTVVQNILIRQL